jgi:hypothetical protein
MGLFYAKMLLVDLLAPAVVKDSDGFEVDLLSDQLVRWLKFKRLKFLVYAL